MATAVMPAMSALTLDREIMPPSPSGANSARHGRSRHGGSVIKGGKGRGRGYSSVEDRESLITKALIWVLKRTVEEGKEVAGDEEKLAADADGWVDAEDLLAMPNLEALGVSFEELRELVASPTTKSRFALKPIEDAEATSTDPSDFLLRINPNAAPRPTSPTTGKLTTLTPDTADLPTLILYESSYPNYPLILASGGIKRAGGQVHLQFASIAAPGLEDDGTEVRGASGADVSIFLNLRSVMEAAPKITWLRAENGTIFTEGDATGVIEKKYWLKAVARRADIGVLFADGEVKKEIPIGLRGKNVKGKRGGGKGKGREVKENVKATSGDEGTESE